jgi:trehalose 6-phosphate synthase
VGIEVGRLVIVSNRVAHPRAAATAGGLATGLIEALRGRGGVWVGWSGDVCSAGAAEPISLTSRDEVTFATFPLPQVLLDRYYSGFANGTLWPLLHYFAAQFRYDEAEYQAYRAANELFGKRLLSVLRDSDVVWIHDYHLIPLGQSLRQLGWRGPIGFFLHVPFPHFEVLRALPVAADLLHALLEYDLVGFQTPTDLSCFLGSVDAVLGRGAIAADGSIRAAGRTCHTGSFPIGVDVDGVGRTATQALALAPVQRMITGLHGRQLIIGVDRLDPTKGLLERFQGYRRFLEHGEAQSGRVTYLQIAPLGRQDVHSYAQIRDALEQSAGRINGRFAEADWTPIRYLNRNFPHTTLTGFLRAAQVCLVTPIRDGMNLVSKEFIAAQDACDPGVLVLSDRAGSAGELRQALIVNPYDTNGIARALHQALEMPLEERQERHEALLESLRHNDIHRWHRDFVDRLVGVGR